jgi:hypothetical protein
VLRIRDDLIQDPVKFRSWPNHYVRYLYKNEKENF